MCIYYMITFKKLVEIVELFCVNIRMVNLFVHINRCPTGWRLKYLKKVDNTEGEYRECEGDIHVGYENGCFTEAIGEQPRISGSIMQSVIFPEVPMNVFPFI